jgi:hypothetical protein
VSRPAASAAPVRMLRQGGRFLTTVASVRARGASTCRRFALSALPLGLFRRAPVSTQQRVTFASCSRSSPWESTAREGVSTSPQKRPLSTTSPSPFRVTPSGLMMWVASSTDVGGFQYQRPTDAGTPHQQLTVDRGVAARRSRSTTRLSAWRAGTPLIDMLDRSAVPMSHALG